MFVPHVAPEFTGFEHAPVLALQVPAVWHASLAVHVTADPTHAPLLLHVSVFVQALPSLQAAPVATGFDQAPVLVLHVPAVWHWSLAVHVTGFDPVHVPLWHAYDW
jgi:hypothetical protein